jgi:hypothetical protein
VAILRLYHAFQLVLAFLQQVPSGSTESPLVEEHVFQGKYLMVGHCRPQPFVKDHQFSDHVVVVVVDDKGPMMARKTGTK